MPPEHPSTTSWKSRTTSPRSSKAMDCLIDLGIAKELTGKARNRVFSCAAYLAALQDGGEPL